MAQKLDAFAHVEKCIRFWVGEYKAAFIVTL